jgi:hypothetical protein
MADDRLVKLVENWENIGWITKRRIDWIIIKSKYKIDLKAVASIVTILAMIAIILGESHGRHLVLLLSSISLLHFYSLLADRLYASG